MTSAEILEKQLISEMNKKPPLSDADNIIITNIVAQIFLTFMVLLVFVIFRNRAKWLYSPNTKDRPHHPCYNHTGMLNWIIPVITVSDTVLLSVIGLDAFMMLQTLKLLYRILFSLSMFVIPLLGCIFWKNPGENIEHLDQWLVRFSLGSLDQESNLYGVVIPVVYIISVFVMYFIFVYYKRYIILRQAYLRNPAIMTSITTLKKLSLDLGSAEDSTSYINIPNRTLIISRLPDYVRCDDDLFEFISSLGVGDVEDCVLVHDTNELQNLYTERDCYVHLFEKEIDNFLLWMNEWSEQNSEMCEESMSGFHRNIFATTRSIKTEEFDDLQKRRLMVTFLNGIKQFGDKYGRDATKFGFYIEKLTFTTKKISREKNIIRGESKHSGDVKIVELVDENDTLFLKADISRDVSFLSLHHILNFRKFRTYFTLDLPTNTSRGFVTFKDQRSASIVKQAQIGSRIFSVSTENAPAPNSIIWSNIAKNEVENYVYSIFGAVFFILFVVLFSFVVVLVATLLMNSNAFKRGAFLASFLERHRKIAKFLKGIFFPLVYNALMMFVPTIITALVNMEGIYSHSLFQQRLIGQLGNFLFFNGFVSVFFASSFVSLFADVLLDGRKIHDVITIFSRQSLESSVFFANTIIQRALIGTALILLKPAPLILNYILVPFTWRKTRRQIFESEFSPPFDFGTIFPACLTVFSMSIVYAIICPPILLLGAVFYSCNYLVFKSEFLYTSRNEYESGGEHWNLACRNIMSSLIFFQMATLAKISADKRPYLSLSLFPIILITIIFRNNLGKIFHKSCYYYPLNIREEKYLDEFTENVLKERISLLESWSEIGSGPDRDVFPLVLLGIKDTEEIEKKSYYRDPSTVTSKSFFILPENFFKIIWFIMSHDKNNVFEFKTE